MDNSVKEEGKTQHLSGRAARTNVAIIVNMGDLRRDTLSDWEGNKERIHEVRERLGKFERTTRRLFNKKRDVMRGEVGGKSGWQAP